MPKRNDFEFCFYCGAPTSRSCQGDHFPIPKRYGGTVTVPCCITCHDMKDRISIDNWNDASVALVMKEMNTLSRETRIFLAKVVTMHADEVFSVTPDRSGVLVCPCL